MIWEKFVQKLQALCDERGWELFEDELSVHVVYEGEDAVAAIMGVRNECCQVREIVHVEDKNTLSFFK